MRTMQGEELLYLVRKLISQEIVRIAKIDDPTKRLEAAKSFYMVAHFAGTYGNAVLGQSAVFANVPSEEVNALATDLGQRSEVFWELWLREAMTSTSVVADARSIDEDEDEAPQPPTLN